MAHAVEERMRRGGRHTITVGIEKLGGGWLRFSEQLYAKVQIKFLHPEALEANLGATREIHKVISIRVMPHKHQCKMSMHLVML